MPLGLSARDRVLPVWEPLYSSKAASWVGMLFERVILGVVAAEGLTGRTERGREGAGEEAGSPALRASGTGRRGREEGGGRGRWGVQAAGWGWGARALTDEDPPVCGHGGRRFPWAACPGGAT